MHRALPSPSGLAALAAAWLLAACDGPAGAGRAASGPDAGDLLPDGARVVPSGKPARVEPCTTDDACSGGDARCEHLLEHRLCVVNTQPATGSSADPSGDQCDASRACPGGSACYAVAVYPSGQCGLGGASFQNMCRSDTCASDADCAGGICGPPGFSSDEFVEGGGVRQCLRAECRSDRDCGAREGGACALVQGGCGSSVGRAAFEPARLACIYPDGCSQNADCPEGASCRVVGGAGVCLTFDR